MTYHPRSDWTSVPAANSNPVIRSLLLGLAIHWNGPKVPLSALTDPRSYLEGVRRYHVGTNHWSDIAYNYAVDQTGDVWELRGWGYQSSANGSELVNDQYLAVLCIVGEGQKPSAAMLAAVRSAVASFRTRYEAARKIVTHKQIRPAGTECPGPDLSREVEAGTFEPPAPRPAPAPTLDPTEESSMILLYGPEGSAYHLTSRGLVWLPKEIRDLILGPRTEIRCDTETLARYRELF